MLSTAIDSVFAQTFGDWELWIVDDGSADDTATIVQRQIERDSRVRYLRREHGGISAAMNAGIRAGKSEYVARLDSDDKWLPDLLKTEVALLDAHPEFGFVYSKAQPADPNLVPRGGPTFGYPPHFPSDPLRSLVWDDCTCNITVVARRACFDRAGYFDESLLVSEDWDMWLRVAALYPFGYVDQVLAHVRSHDGSTTSAKSDHFDEFLGGRRKVLDKFFALPSLPAEIHAMKRVAYRNLYISVGILALSAGDRRRARRFFGEAIRASGGPAAAFGRIAFFILANKVLNRTAAGRSLLRWQSEFRSRLRLTRASRDGLGAQ